MWEQQQGEDPTCSSHKPGVQAMLSSGLSYPIPFHLPECHLGVSHAWLPASLSQSVDIHARHHAAKMALWS